MAWWLVQGIGIIPRIVKGKPKAPSTKLTNEQSLLFFEKGVVDLLQEKQRAVNENKWNHDIGVFGRLYQYGEGQTDERLCNESRISAVRNDC
jgi:hypothetical protein